MLISSSRPLLVGLVLALLLTGCDLFSGDDDESFVTSGVVVGNSGNFSAQDGSLTLYDPASDEAGLNDVNVAFIQSLAVRDTLLYVVDNTSADNAGRVTIYGTGTVAPVGQIENPRPPLSIAFASGDKAYVTNLSRFGGPPDFEAQPSTVSVLDLSTNTVVDTVRVGASPQGIAVANGRAFVANAADNTLTVLDVETDQVSETMDLGCVSPNGVFVDEEDEIVVVCTGDGSTNGEVLFLDAASLNVRSRLDLSTQTGSSNGTQGSSYDPVSGELYVIDGGGFAGPRSGRIYRVNTTDNVLAGSFVVPSSESLTTMSAVGYDGVNEQLYVTRLPVGPEGGPDFEARGTAVVLDRDGNQVGSFTTGVAPGFVTFLRDSR